MWIKRTSNKIMQIEHQPIFTKEEWPEIRHYLQYLIISNSSLLVHGKSNLFHPTFETIAIPKILLRGLINALQIKLNHPSKTKFKKVWHRCFFALDAGKLIDECTQFCHLCNSLTLFRMDFFGAAHDLSHISYNDET